LADDEHSTQPTTADLFALLWNDLVDVLGTSATATLLRRAAKHGVKHAPGLDRLVIHRPVFEYEYVLPIEWTNAGNGERELHALCKTLVPLLRDLTGGIVLHRLRSIPNLAPLVDDAEGSAS
jgi:hypothetical protein